MRRLVYSPKVQAWINGTEGVVDISPYIVSGQVNRKINQVSTASLVLRNPVNQSGKYVGTLFTEFPRADGTTGPLFHPMDPIIITMQRLEGHPVQVFTGYLDKSPYLQLYPGLCQIEASCTLKRLQYTQFDAALPFVQYFLSLFGWVPDGNSGIMNPTAETAKLKVFAGQLQNQFNDGSIGSLIYAILLYIGQWDNSTIFIEELPANIRDYVVTLFTRLESDVNQDQTVFQNLITQILGNTSMGSGNSSVTAGNGSVGGSLTVRGGAITDAQRKIAFQLLDIGAQLNAPQAAMAAIVYAGIWESNLSPGASNGSFWGVLSGSVNTWAQNDTNGMATAFYKGGGGFQSGGAISQVNSGVTNPAEIAVKVEVPSIWPSNAYAQEAGYPGDSVAIAEAQRIVSAYLSQTGSTSGTKNGKRFATTGSAPAAGMNDTGNSAASLSGRSPGGKKGKGSQVQLAFPLPKGTAVAQSSWTKDDGVDIAAPALTPLLAIAAGTVTYANITGFSNGSDRNVPVLHLDQPINGYNYVYYGHADTTGHISDGARVTAGQQIGAVGAGIVGMSTGPHLEIGFAQNAAGDPVGPSSAGGMFSTLVTATQGGVVTSSGTTSSLTNGTAGTTSSATAAAFSTMINLPSIFQSAEAIAFTGKRSFIADSPLFPFIEQLCQASLRNFMSMPNGNFFAFFPDYFGLFGRNYYWEVRDIEIMDGRIDLSDDPLATHVAIAGDVTQFHGTVDVFDLLLTAGIFDIFDAFALGYINGPDSMVNSDLTSSGKKFLTGKERAQTRDDALKFLQKYGARTYVEEVPAIRSPFFELFYSFMKFMLLWSKQFMTTFELTFMPELFPGGLVALPDHDLQLYVEEVVHSFDYTNGFTTTAHFSSPSRLNDQSRPNLREGLTRVSAGQFTNVSNPLDTKVKGSKT